MALITVFALGVAISGALDPLLLLLYDRGAIPALGDPGSSTRYEYPGGHPYGYAVQGPLPWDGNDRVRAALEKAGASLLISAFQTTLPDPILGEEFNVAVAADTLAGAVVKPGQVFSLNQRLGARTREKGYREGPMYLGNRIQTTVGGGVCKIATTLYNTVILANLQIVERHPHSMQVPYVPPGQDATISFGSIDLKFRNDTKSPIVIWADTVGYTLFIAIYGTTAPPTVTWGHQTLNRTVAPEIRRTNAHLPKGSSRVMVAGYDGLAVRSWLTISYPDGREEKRDLGTDWYRPMPRVVEVHP